MSLTVDAVKQLVPRGHRNNITEEFLDKLSDAANDIEVSKAIQDNFVTYLGVLSDGRYKMEDYLSAITYNTHKVMGKNNRESWIATFPERYQRLVDEGQTQIDAYVSMYNSNKLVNQIAEQLLIPTYILNAPQHQIVLNELFKLAMGDEVRGMAKVRACEAYLDHTKQPEVIKNELTIGLKRDDTIDELRAAAKELARESRKQVMSGNKTLKDTAEEKIIDIK